MPTMSGAKFIADTLKAYGVTHVFVVPAILQRALAEMDLVGIKKIITHGEKAAAYMADGYARASNRPGVCMAQSVGAANLAAGLQDAFLGLAPVIALTGHKRHDEQYRNAYQEIEHSKPFASVTKFSAVVENVDQLPRLMRQAFREATTGGSGPSTPRHPGNERQRRLRSGFGLGIHYRRSVHATSCLPARGVVRPRWAPAPGSLHQGRA